jgi:hypothetical protein
MPNSSLSVGFVTESLWQVVETCMHRSQGNHGPGKRRPQQPAAKLPFKNKELELVSKFDSG